jgi:hypothetical protein
MSPHLQPRVSSTAKSTSGNLSPSPTTRTRRHKTLSSFRFPARRITCNVLGIIPYFLQYTDVSPTGRKAGAGGRMKEEERGREKNGRKKATNKTEKNKIIKHTTKN